MLAYWLAYRGCRARLTRQVAQKRQLAYWGRCDGKRAHAGEHYLERGFDCVFFDDRGLPVARS